jgi:hypothetical protein
VPLTSPLPPPHPTKAKQARRPKVTQARRKRFGVSSRMGVWRWENELKSTGHPAPVDLSREYGRADYQLLPRVSPPFGVIADHHVAAVIPEVTLRTLPSANPTRTAVECIELARPPLATAG